MPGGARPFLGQEAVARGELSAWELRTQYRSVYRNANPDTLKITERFTRVAADKLRWSVTLDDPKTWTRPWTFSMPLTMNDAEPIQLYECHEGNYGLRNILSAARAEERDAASATKP